MISRDKLRQVNALALPIIGGMVSQNILNLVDTAMVGQLGTEALAAVGMAGFVNFMCIALVMGLSAGVQAISARRLGEGRVTETAIPLNGGLVLGVAFGLPMSIVLIFWVPDFFVLLVDDPLVSEFGAPYLQARLVAMSALAINYAFRGYWNGVNLSKIYMRTLVLMHISNVILNYLLIFGNFGFPELGTLGAGIGTATANYIGSAIYIVMALKLARPAGFLRALPSRATLKNMLQISMPVSVQQLFFATGMTVFFWLVGRMGTVELAANNVLVNLLLVCILPGIGFGLASASLVGQALGRGEPAEAMDWGWTVCKISFVCITLISLPAMFFPGLFLGVFIHDPATLQVALLPLRLVALGIGIDTLGLVLFNALMGAGYTRVPMALSIVMQWVIFLPFAYWMGPELGLAGIWIGQMVYRGVQALILLWIWKQGHWASVKV